MVTTAQAQLGAQRAVQDVQRAADAVNMTNANITALMKQAMVVRQTGNAHAEAALLATAQKLKRDAIATRAHYAKQAKVAQLMIALASLKKDAEAAAARGDKAHADEANKGAAILENGIKKLSSTSIALKLPPVNGGVVASRLKPRLHGFGALGDIFSDIGSAFSDAGSWIGDNIGAIGGVVGAAVGAATGNATVGGAIAGASAVLNKVINPPAPPSAPTSPGPVAPSFPSTVPQVPNNVVGLPPSTVPPGGVLQVGSQPLWNDPTAHLAGQPVQPQSFFARYKWPLLGVGGLLVIGGGVLLYEM